MAELTTEQRFQFDNLGYLIIENALSPEEIAKYKQAAYALAKQKHPEPEAWDSRGEPAGRIRVHRPIEKDPLFLEMIDHPSVIDIILELTGGAPKLIDNDVDFVPRDYSMQDWHRGTNPHFGYSVNNGRLFSTMTKVIYYLTDVNEGEGPTRIVPASHKSHMPIPQVESAKDDLPGTVYLTVKAGTAMIFCESLLHAGNVNDSDKVRINMYFNYGPSWVEAWEGYTPSKRLVEQSTGLRRQLLGGGRIYGNTEEEGAKMYP